MHISELNFEFTFICLYRCLPFGFENIHLVLIMNEGIVTNRCKTLQNENEERNLCVKSSVNDCTVNDEFMF